MSSAATTREKILDFLKEHPGATMEEISKGINHEFSRVETHVNHIRREGCIDGYPPGEKRKKQRYSIKE